jgi:hypothetical protein
MLHLQSFDKHNEFLELYSNRLEIIDYGKPSTNGWFKIINNITTSFFWIGTSFYMRIGEKEYVLPESFKANSMFISGITYQFKLYDEMKQVSQFEYESDKSLFGIAPFEYIDEEDFNWGLFLSNIINNPIRKALCLTNRIE